MKVSFKILKDWAQNGMSQNDDLCWKLTKLRNGIRRVWKDAQLSNRDLQQCQNPKLDVFFEPAR